MNDPSSMHQLALVGLQVRKQLNNSDQPYGCRMLVHLPENLVVNEPLAQFNNVEVVLGITGWRTLRVNRLATGLSTALRTIAQGKCEGVCCFQLITVPAPCLHERPRTP
jgi:hypothetical protein